MKKKGPPLKLNQSETNNQSAIYADPNYGPTFGAGHDIYTFSWNTNLNSYTSVGLSYILPAEAYGPYGKASAYFASAVYFHIDEIEVYQKVN